MNTVHRIGHFVEPYLHDRFSCSAVVLQGTLDKDSSYWLAIVLLHQYAGLNLIYRTTKESASTFLHHGPSPSVVYAWVHVPVVILRPSF